MHRLPTTPPKIRTEFRYNGFAINYEERNTGKKYLDVHWGFETPISINSENYPEETIHNALSTLAGKIKEGILTEDIIQDLKREIENTKL